MIEDLHTRYTVYQYSYCKLVVELARRAEYAEAASKIVRSMMSQLEALTDGSTAFPPIVAFRLKSYFRGKTTEGAIQRDSWRPSSLRRLSCDAESANAV